MTTRVFSAERLLRPLPAAGLVPLAAAVLVAGAAYCLGYDGLRGGIGHWPASLLWSACAVLPWLALFEAVKRREARLGAPLPGAPLAAALLATGIVSVALEMGSDWLAGDHPAPIGLQLLRRAPAIGATLLLLLLARRERGARPAASEADLLRRDAPRIRWIRAADNYLELHLEGRVVMRRATMREATALLAPLGFVRVHRSFLVRRGEIEVVRRDRLRLRDGTELPVGRAYAAGLDG